MDNQPQETIGERTETFRVNAEVAEGVTREVARPETGEGFVGFLVNYTQRSDVRIEIESEGADDVLNVAERASAPITPDTPPLSQRPRSPTGADSHLESSRCVRASRLG